MEKLGIIKSIDVMGYRNYLADMIADKKAAESHFPADIREKFLPFEEYCREKWIDHEKQEPAWKVRKHVEQYLEDWFDAPARHLTALEVAVEYAESYGQPITYYFADNNFVFFSCQNLCFAVPVYLTVLQPYKDYEEVDSVLLGQEALSGNLPSLRPGLSVKKCRSQIEDKRLEIEKAMEDIRAKEAEQKAEIERIKAEIEAQYANMFELLNQKKQQLLEQQAALENELFLLDTQIYGIRCFSGEVVKFTRLVSGKNAPTEEPVVLHQKMRYLDEELGKWIALYDFDGDDTPMFEELIKHREDLRDLFFPGEKSISLVRISREKFRKIRSYQEFSCQGTVTVEQVVNTYNIYHAEQIGILVRNGENCYIGWTDEDRIKLSDDNAFLTPKDTIEPAPEEKKDPYWSKEPKEDRTSNKIDFVSRYFLFNVMQGLVHDNQILQLPEGVNILSSHSGYVIYSMADAWLTDTRYGDLDDILISYGGIGMIQKGDKLLTCRAVRPEGHVYKSYSNDRGIGYANRTHDVCVSDCTIYAVNKLKNTPKSKWSYELRQIKDLFGRPVTESVFKKKVEFSDYTDETTFFERHSDTYEYRDLEVSDANEQTIYISLEKDENWLRTYRMGGDDGFRSRANFHLYSDEYINLTFLNTSLITYLLTTRRIGKNHSFANFSASLPYLNAMMEYLKEREKRERELIEPYVKLNGDWQMALSDWKIENNVHEITDYQAKRFAKKYQGISE